MTTHPSTIQPWASTDSRPHHPAISPGNGLPLSSRALLIFARKPVPGRVKTRLTPPLEPRQAAELYHCMLLDVLARAASLPDTDLLLFYEEQPGAREFFAALGTRASLHPQSGEDLGERMKGAFDHAFGLGYKRVAIIGTDSPDLPRRLLLEAFRILESAPDVTVFGPSEDGGYYLLGLSVPHGEPFAGIPWSTKQVLEKSLHQCREAGLPTELLPPWYDLDTVEDLLRPTLLASGDEAPRTLQLLNSLPLSAPT